MKNNTIRAVPDYQNGPCCFY